MAYSRIYISSDLHAALKAYCDKHETGIGYFASAAIVERLLNKGMARRWVDGSWQWYEVEEIATSEDE